MPEMVWVFDLSYLVLKEIHDIFKTKNPTNEKINKYKMTERKIYEKFDNLSDEELNTKSNKTIYATNDVIITVIKRCRGEKKRYKSNRWIKKKK